MVEIEVDVNLLQDRLRHLGAVDLRPLAGGASSLSYIATLADGGVERPAVVKIAPPGLEPVRNRDMLRQARVLRGLAGTGVPVPEVLWEDAGDPPAVPPLFVMAFVEGSSFEPLFDDDGDDPGSGRGRADARRGPGPRRAALGRARRRSASATSRVVSLDDEVGRWVRLLRDRRPRPRPGVAGGGGLAPRRPRPTPMAPSIVHGDFRLGNLLASGPTVTAVIDWEIWSVSDPRVDVGWFLVNADPDTYRRGTAYTGLTPTPAELAATYAQAVGRDVPDLDWFQALACFKSTATWSLIVKHNRRRSDPDPVAEQIAVRAPRPAGAGRGRCWADSVPRDALEPVGELRLGLGLPAQDVLRREQVGGGRVALEQQPGQRDLVHLGGAVGQARARTTRSGTATNGISCEVPSEPWICRARALTSCSTFCIIAFTAEMSARTAL